MNWAGFTQCVPAASVPGLVVGQSCRRRDWRRPKSRSNEHPVIIRFITQERMRNVAAQANVGACFVWELSETFILGILLEEATKGHTVIQREARQGRHYVGEPWSACAARAEHYCASAGVSNSVLLSNGSTAQSRKPDTLRW